ncbi:MAG: hypothetical protein IPM93_24445 [Candidatus Obscuribacter sp.]|nr:hypothetical protein [Candidatus Obscuribacter sp.]
MYVSIRHTKKTGGNCFATGYEIKAKEKNNFEMEIPEDGEVQVSISHLCGVSSDKLNLEVTGDLTVTYNQPTIVRFKPNSASAEGKVSFSDGSQTYTGSIKVADKASDKVLKRFLKRFPKMFPTRSPSKPAERPARAQ